MPEAFADLLPWLILFPLLACAVWTDCSDRRIPNWLTGSALVAGLFWQLFGQSGVWAFHPETPGTTGFSGYLLGGGVMLAIFVPFFLWRIFGAGDVKLLWAVGALSGGSTAHWGHLPGIVLSVLLAGGVLAVVRMAWLGISGRAISGAMKTLGAAVSAEGAVSGARGGTADRMPYAVAIAAGTSGYILAVRLGWIA